MRDLIYMVEHGFQKPNLHCGQFFFFEFQKRGGGGVILVKNFNRKKKLQYG